ncbi:DEAD/DEAH box helicase family protein [Porticoccaceae bacterium]|nr:DEAD/DEAH box helicase family protein [Porticoccaceae bacterium]MDB9706570.1 DEAD/DEAH box helicase family protein [Porticoccaceae bacterium]MDB9804759.1 DEAD/DEAH box helicase family protein [Porticoccaceae bacterium]
MDEYHRGGANDESSWRDVLDYFSPAIQLVLTATPNRNDNTDTYCRKGSSHIRESKLLKSGEWEQRRRMKPALSS